MLKLVRLEQVSSALCVVFHWWNAVQVQAEPRISIELTNGVLKVFGAVQVSVHIRFTERVASTCRATSALAFGGCLQHHSSFPHPRNLGTAVASAHS